MVFTTAGGGATQESATYEIDNSLRTGGGDDHHLSMVYSSAASDANRRKFTFSGWIKLGQAAHFTENYPNEKYLLTATDAAQSTTNVGYGGYTSGNAGGFHFQDGRSGTYIETTTKFRDPSAWYHLVIKYDSTQITASDRIFIYVNGESQPLNYSNTGDPEVDLNTMVDFFLAGDDVDATSADSGNFVHNVNSYMNSGFGAVNNSFDGHFADWYLLDGQALAPTEFGETNDNGVWVPKKYEGTFNSHSFHLEFKQTGSSADSSGMGADTSGQDNHFKVGVNSTLAAVDITTDTPTNNFCTMSPIDTNTQASLSEGNTQLQRGSNYAGCNGTFGVASGKWYWEIKTPTPTTSGENSSFGVSKVPHATIGNNYLGINTNSWAIMIDNAASDIYKNYNNSFTDTGINASSNDIFQIALDMDNNKVYFGRNGTYFDSGDPAGNSNETYSSVSGDPFIFPAFSMNGDNTLQANFGNAPFSISSSNADANGYGSFEYAVPSGFYSLCTKNLAEYG